MGKYLITGRGGTGKSAIFLELQNRDYPAFDADKVPGLCRWEDRQTGEPIEVDPSGYIDFKKVSWAWQDTILHKLLSESHDLILCGSSSNQEDYYLKFDKIFVLILDQKTHLHRLQTRDFDYGKDSKLQQELVAGHQLFASKLLKAGAIPVDVTQPLDKVVNDILAHCDLPNLSRKSR